jgi:hypothetical protein
MAVSQGWSRATGKGFNQISENLRDFRNARFGERKMPLIHEQGQVTQLFSQKEVLIYLN